MRLMPAATSTRATNSPKSAAITRDVSKTTAPSSIRHRIDSDPMPEPGGPSRLCCPSSSCSKGAKKAGSASYSCAENDSGSNPNGTSTCLTRSLASGTDQACDWSTIPDRAPRSPSSPTWPAGSSAAATRGVSTPRMAASTGSPATAPASGPPVAARRTRATAGSVSTRRTALISRGCGRTTPAKGVTSPTSRPCGSPITRSARPTSREPARSWPNSVARTESACSASDPMTTGSLVIGSDALQADSVLATLLGQDRAGSRLVGRALRVMGEPQGRLVGDVTPFAGVVRPHPLLINAVRRVEAEPAVARVLGAATGGPDAGAVAGDPVLAAIRGVLTPLVAAADEPAGHVGLLGLLSLIHI